MSNPLAPLAIRLFCDLAARNQAVMDLNTGQAPLFYRGDDVEIDIGMGEDGRAAGADLVEHHVGDVPGVRQAERHQCADDELHGAGGGDESDADGGAVDGQYGAVLPRGVRVPEQPDLHPAERGGVAELLAAHHAADGGARRKR